MSIKNIDASKAAQDALELAVEVLESWPYASKERFWEHVARAAAKNCGHEICLPKSGEKPDPYRMTDEEAIKFEKQIVPFGTHAGCQVGMVDVEYWFAITESEFNRRLVRYMRSAYFRARVDKEG